MAAASPFSVPVGSSKTTALLYPADEARATLVLGHGAGAPQTHPWMVAMAQALAALGIEVVTFNFLYAETKRRAPDRNDVLEATWRAVVEAVRARAPGEAAARRLFIGGKSMGGRIATQVAASGSAGALAGLVLLGYPLHPPGKPAQLRAAHLPAVRAPMLFVQGSRDAFGTPEELRPVLAGLGDGGDGSDATRRTRLFVVEGGDHSFSVPRSAGRTPEAIRATVSQEISRFIG
jgi:predicted alpha/beta-hydrolase family hydrolase